MYPDDKATVLAYIEVGTGLGMSLGPPLGSFIYSKLGYMWAFYVFAIANIIALYLCAVNIPNRINHISETVVADDEDEEVD